MPLAVCNGIRLHYQRLGRGPEVVLIHGLATNLAFWYLRVAPLLRRHFCLILYDLRGHGRSDMPPTGYTTADMAADLHALLTHLGVARVHLVGHSYGGAVALHYAVLYPERVGSVTLADARIRAFQPTQRLSDWPDAPRWARQLHELDATAPLEDSEMGYRFMEALAKAQLRGQGLARREPRRFVPFGGMPHPSRTAAQWLRLLDTTTARKDFAALAGLTPERIAGVTRPVLAIFGEKSHCLPSCWALQRHLPRCKVVLVPRAGHFHPLVRPVFFVRHVRRFLQEVTRDPC
ncbi:MAG: hypothetical protein KatS3mg131_0067 [Candidatus Tectimicrobiota bacterium]|nr:MAG: hypothetical protein KatS3mg131_0067 [Candidatus Tectomicrobia bacterium]